MTDDLGDLEWRLVREEALDGATAMAYDQVAAETVAGGGPATVRVYQWRPGALSLGYHQDPDTVDWEGCADRGVDIVRRPTGGGGIYHDTEGDISYSIVAPAEALPGNLMECYDLLCQPILDAFREMGVDAGFAEEARDALYEPSCYLRDVNPAHDVVVRGDGRKISGNAQYRTRDAVVQHGSLTYEVTPERTLACFVDPGVTPEQVRDRVTDIRSHADAETARAADTGPVESPDSRAPGRNRAVRVLEESLAGWAGIETERGTAADGGWTDAERERATELAETKYRTDTWNREREDPTD